MYHYKRHTGKPNIHVLGNVKNIAFNWSSNLHKTSVNELYK